MYSEKLMNALMMFVLGVLAVKFIFFGGFFKSTVHKGNGYSMIPPPGWEEIKEKRGVRPVLASADKPEVVTFITPERDLITGVPEASLSILTVKLSQPTWMEDEFPSLLEALAKAGNQIKDHGQIKIDTMISWWVFYEEPKTSLLSLEFYMVNDINRLYKIQFSTDPDGFGKYRQAFEAAKDSIRFSGKLW